MSASVSRILAKTHGLIGCISLSIAMTEAPAAGRVLRLLRRHIRRVPTAHGFDGQSRSPRLRRQETLNVAFRAIALFWGIGLTSVWTTHAQLDPEPRQLLHLGVNQSLHNDGPQAHYLFYYWNMPDVASTNRMLRLVIAPTYLDGELGFKGVLGENTDVGLGLFGGGYAYNYEEVRRGNYFRDESFDGHGGGAKVSIYHLFNPNAKVPLNGLLRAAVDYRTFDSRDDTADTFAMPDNQPFITLRIGLRYGGHEPVLFPRLAFELSAWYELQHRADDSNYGFMGDRRLEPTTHRFLARAQFNYTLPNSEHYMVIGLMGGAVSHADRFSAFRVGGALPFTSEFPLYLPGYFFEELSAQNFGLAYGFYQIPLGPAKRWNVMAMVASALVDYVDGLNQPGYSNSGVGGGFGYTARNRRWRMQFVSSYGIDAIRNNGRGGYNAGMMFQYNFGATTFTSDRAFEELRGVRVPVR